MWECGLVCKPDYKLIQVTIFPAYWIIFANIVYINLTVYIFQPLCLQEHKSYITRANNFMPNCPDIKKQTFSLR